MQRYLVAIFILLAVLPARAQVTRMTGEIGVDLEGYGFSRKSGSELLTERDVVRNRSGHYLNLSLRGEIGKNRFATYSGFSKLLGVYFTSHSGDQDASEYVGPELSAYTVQTTLLTGKPYPIQFYRSSSNEHALRFENNNRSLDNFLRPALSVIRRYDNKRDAHGLRWNLKPNEVLNSVVEYKQETTRNNRVYTFDEDRDIWVEYVPSVARPGDSVFTAIFINKLPDTVDVIIVNLDSLSINGGPPQVKLDNIGPGETRTTDLYIGRNEIQAGAAGYNQFADVIDLSSNLSVYISYRDPAAPNDVDQTRTTATTFTKYEGLDGRLSNETRFEYSDLHESVQDLTNYLNTFTNTAIYQPSSNTTVNSLTTFSRDKTRVSTVSDQFNRVISQQTSVGYIQRRGLAATLSHNYAGTLSDNQGTAVRSSLNNLRGQVSYPTNWHEHFVSLREELSFRSDNSGYANDQYTTTLTNGLVGHLGKIAFQPRHELRYAISKQRRPNQESTELESKLALAAERTVAIFGDVQVRTEHNFRSKSDDAGSDVKNRYLVDVSSVRRFGHRARIGLSLSQEWERFGGTAPTPGAGTNSAREPQHKQSYRFDAEATPVEDLMVGGTYMLTSQSGSTIQKYGATIITVLPYLRLPVKSFLLYESRELSGLKPQTTLSIDTKLTYNFRRITLVLNHSYRVEKLQFDEFSQHEILARITRQFNVL